MIDLEREMATRAVCAACGTEERLLRPLDGLTVGSALCPSCGDERRIEFIHSITSADDALLSLTPRELGLPAYDVVTGRSGTTRVHYLLDGPLDSLGQLA